MPAVDPTHQHYASQVIVDNTHRPIDPNGGSTPTLAEVLAAGNTTGAHLIDLGGGTIDGTGNGVVEQATADIGMGGGWSINANNGAAGENGGQASINGGGGDGGNATGGFVQANGGLANGAGGLVNVAGGDAETASGKAGGDITLTPGAGDGAGRNGLVFLNLPTSDPHVAGALYSDGVPSAGVPKAIMVSGG